MKFKGSGRTFIVSRAVEEPLEATFELGEDIEESSKNLAWPITLSILGCILIIFLLITNIYYLFFKIYDIYKGNLDLSLFKFSLVMIQSLLVIFLIAIVSTTMIYLVQINKFTTHLSQRYALVAELQSARVSDGVKQKKVEKNKKKRSSNGLDVVEDYFESKKLKKNPIFAMMDLVEESMHALPQIIKLLRFCTYFIMMIMVAVLFWIIISMSIIEHHFYRFTSMELILGVLGFVIFIPTLESLINSETLFRYLLSRHDIIDSVRFRKDLNIPKGKGQVKRLIKYLTKNDPYIKSSILAKTGTFQNGSGISDSIVGGYKFDAYLSGANILKSRSVGLGMPMGEYGVFIKVFKSPITLDKLQKLRQAVLDVCSKKDLFPLRIIALQWTVSELDEETYNYVLENPIELKNTLTHLEVVAEDGEVYSFIPIISYGKEM